jgi:predicted DNA-binding transcriptional regulator AlpA
MLRTPESNETKSSRATPKKPSLKKSRSKSPKKTNRRPRFRSLYAIPGASSGRVLLDRNETALRVGCHPVTLYTWMKTIDGFPIPIRITKHRIAFYEDEVTAYIDSRPRVAVDKS